MGVHLTGVEPTSVTGGVGCSSIIIQGESLGTSRTSSY